MSKRAKNAGNSATGAKPTPNEISAFTAQTPRKSPGLLAVSILLFAAWFVFLLVTALTA